MMNIKKGNQNGFTLIEVLIGITVFAIGILALTIMQIGAVKGNSSAGSLTEASTVGQDKLEELMTLDYANVVDLNDDDGDGTGQDTDGDGVDDDGGNFGLDDLASPDGTAQYQGTTNIQYNIFWNIAVDHPFPNTKTIRLIVNWNERGRLRTVTFDSLKNANT